jgi:hypothetical protein
LDRRIYSAVDIVMERFVSRKDGLNQSGVYVGREGSDLSNVLKNHNPVSEIGGMHQRDKE